MKRLYRAQATIVVYFLAEDGAENDEVDTYLCEEATYTDDWEPVIRAVASPRDVDPGFGDTLPWGLNDGEPELTCAEWLAAHPEALPAVEPATPWRTKRAAPPEPIAPEPGALVWNRLTWDLTVATDSPIVKGTKIAASHVAALVRDGWPWADILRAHPELSEEDVRQCMAYEGREAIA